MPDEKIIQISASEHSLYALTNDGRIYQKYYGDWSLATLPPLRKVKPHTPTNKKTPYGSNGSVRMTEEQYNKLCNKYTKEVVNSKLEDMVYYMNRTNKEYKDHYLALNKWLLDDTSNTDTGQRPTTREI